MHRYDILAALITILGKRYLYQKTVEQTLLVPFSVLCNVMSFDTIPSCVCLMSKGDWVLWANNFFLPCYTFGKYNFAPYTYTPRVCGVLRATHLCCFEINQCQYAMYYSFMNIHRKLSFPQSYYISAIAISDEISMWKFYQQFNVVPLSYCHTFLWLHQHLCHRLAIIYVNISSHSCVYHAASRVRRVARDC